jgi:hypothetical protein
MLLTRENRTGNDPRMAEMSAHLQFSETFPEADRQVIRQSFVDEGIDTENAENDLAYKGVAVSPENLVIGFFVSGALLQFLQGYFSAAGADAWAATKRAFKRVRAAHDGGQEVTIVDEAGKTHARYILPSDPSQRDIAIDAISDDFAALEHVQERWWLGPPESRWGTGLEAAEKGNP